MLYINFDKIRAPLIVSTLICFGVIKFFHTINYDDDVNGNAVVITIP